MTSRYSFGGDEHIFVEVSEEMSLEAFFEALSTANQFRLILHTAAYWLMLALRDAVPRRMDLAGSEFATLRQKLLKIGARVIEKAARIRIHFASACPDAALFRMLAGRLDVSGPLPPGRRAPPGPDPSTPNPDIENLQHRNHKGAEQKPLCDRN